MRNQKKFKVPFKLTPSEQAVLELHQEFPEYSVHELCSQLGVGDTTLYSAMEKDKLRRSCEKEPRGKKMTLLRDARPGSPNSPKSRGHLES